MVYPTWQRNFHLREDSCTSGERGTGWRCEGERGREGQGEGVRGERGTGRGCEGGEMGAE